EPERYATGFARTIEVVDHRLLGTRSARGAEAALQQLRSWLDLAGDFVVQEDDVLRLQPDALLSRRTFSGTDRAGGGPFGRRCPPLLVFGGDGLLTRSEYFDFDREAEALARFDELTSERALVPPSEAVTKALRRVRVNAATANAAHLDAAVAAREADALLTLF